MSRELSPEVLRILRLADAKERRREVALSASEIGVFEFDPATSETYWDPRVREIFGVSADTPTNYDLVMQAVHPEDQDLHNEGTAAVLDPNGSRHLDIVYRLYPLDGQPMRWVRARGDCIFAGDAPIRLVGTVQDITKEKMQEHNNEQLLYELEHRVKNTLSTAIAVLDLSRIGQSDVDGYYGVASDRLRAIALSHDALRRAEWSDVDLHLLLTREAERFLGSENKRLHLSGDPVHLPANNVMTMSMVFHELLTNATKYGALLNPGGEIHVQTTQNASGWGLTWTETGLTTPPALASDKSGFGTILLNKIMPAELGASVTRDITADGLIFQISYAKTETME